MFESRQVGPVLAIRRRYRVARLLHAYVQEIESLTKTRVSIVSMGPDRAQTHEMVTESLS